MNKLTSLADEELVGLYTEGNNEAFDILLNRYESKVYTYVSYFVRNREAAEDLFQDIFMRVVTTIRSDKYTEQQKFSSWLMRISHNIVIDYFRHQKNEKSISNDESDSDLFNDIRFSDGDNVEKQMVRQQVLMGVQDIIKMLPKNQQEIIDLRYYQDKSFKEIAELLNCSINTALGRTRYALINLRRLALEYNISLAS